MNMKQSCKALICAIEGELDGRHCTEEQAAAILDHALPSLTEALARVEVELAEALGEIRIYQQKFRYIADGGSFYLSTAAECVRLTSSFLAMHANTPDAQAEQQEAQGAQAGDERAVFVQAVRAAAKEFGEEADEDGLRRDAFGEFVHAELKQLLRICQLYRTALDTQPAAGVPAAWECVHGGYVSLSYEKEGDPERAVPLFRSAPPAAGTVAAGEPIQVEAVAVAREGDDGLYLDWVLEGGISALEAPGVVLLVSHGTVTDDQGSGEVYLAPPAAAPGDESVRKLWLPTPEQVMHVVMKFYWEDRRDGAGTTNWAANFGTAVVEYVARLNQAQSAGSHGDARVDNLAALTRRLVQALRKAAPDHALPAQALDYLGRNGCRAIRCAPRPAKGVTHDH